MTGLENCHPADPAIIRQELLVMEVYRALILELGGWWGPEKPTVLRAPHTSIMLTEVCFQQPNQLSTLSLLEPNMPERRYLLED